MQKRLKNTGLEGHTKEILTQVNSHIFLYSKQSLSYKILVVLMKDYQEPHKSCFKVVESNYSEAWNKRQITIFLVLCCLRSNTMMKLGKLSVG